ncbi:hypothetical protein CRENBAI_019751 [Crenichthys baileyi]|uniref:Uncharacterized protein n=1 Tax=Crenichthys baileyi TaxID=28760 RepID=A0AAV9QT86_9TELE
MVTGLQKQTVFQRVPSRDPVSLTLNRAGFPGVKERQRDRITVATAVTCSSAAPPHSYRGFLQALVVALKLLFLDSPSFQASKCSSNQAPADSLKPPWTHWPLEPNPAHPLSCTPPSG